MASYPLSCPETLAPGWSRGLDRAVRFVPLLQSPSSEPDTMAVPQGAHLLPSILEAMRCPRCSDDLRIDGEHLACGGCEARFPFREGIPLLAIQGTTETWTDRTAEETSEEYQRAYQEVDEARKYNEAYRDRWTKRWSTQREYRLLERLLSSQPRSHILLDLPSGGGRLSPQLSRYGDLLVEADIALGQLLYGKGNHGGQDPRIWMTASAFHIPFRDEAVDAVVCCRLCHHLPTPDERERLVSELLRVARRFVIMTFFGHYSMKNWVRRARAPFDGQPPKMTMTIERVRELAGEHGAELVSYSPLSRLFSGHRYALMVKG